MSTDTPDIHDPADDEQEVEDLQNESEIAAKPLRFRYLRELLSLFTVVLLVVVFRSVVFEPFKIPSGSMIPTLRIGDFILVNKFTYGLKVPFSDLSLGVLNLDPIYLLKLNEVKRGDVIVFKYPVEPNIYYIKRVIGLPGETIEIKNKKVFINDEPLKMKELPKEPFMKTMDEKFKDTNFTFYEVTLKDRKFVYQVDEDNYFRMNLEKKLIPKDSYFVIGDNRDFSYDSRYWGVVPHRNVKGKAFLVWLSMNFPDNPEEEIIFRSDRIGKLIK
ncbi:MAG: signal peptidase I [Bdellovibrionota bacterium]|nr:signal peptidase I [Bdellovibrionota bacterium]